MIHCAVCGDDGWLAFPSWADATKTTVRIRKVACPHGCPLADPNEPGVLPEFPKDDPDACWPTVASDLSNLSREQVLQAMEKLPTDALEWAVGFEALAHPGPMPTSQPPAFAITASDAREVVRITPDGQVIVNPEFTIDEVARRFWQAVQHVIGVTREAYMFCDHERYQVHCRFCQEKLEADSAAEVIQMAEKHEATCPERKECL